MKLFEVTQKALDGVSEKGQIQLVSRNPKEIKEISNPSEAVQTAAIKADWFAITYIDNPSDEMYKLAISINPYTIGYMVEHGIKPSDEMIYNALTHPGLQYNEDWAKYGYPEVVAKLFNDNELLYKKWMRYWQKHKGQI